MTASCMAFHQTKVSVTPYSSPQQVKIFIALITNESAAKTRLAWLTSNASAGQLITTSCKSHAAYQNHA